jgi:hypothetical protein
VVICRSLPDAHDALYRDLVPAHGLGLLMLDPATLPGDMAGVQASLAARIFDLERVPRKEVAARVVMGREARAEARGQPVAPEWTPVKVERTAVAPAVEQGVGMIVGLALACVLIAEVYLDVVYVFGAGRVVLAFAIALEACSRGSGRSPPRAPVTGRGRARARSEAPRSSSGTPSFGRRAGRTSSRPH